MQLPFSGFSALLPKKFGGNPGYRRENSAYNSVRWRNNMDTDSSMSQASPTKTAKWPLRIGIVSVMYGLLFGLVYVRPPAADASWVWPLINITIAVCFSGGAVGVLACKRWGVSSLLLGSYIVLPLLIYWLATIFEIMGGVPPIFALLAIMTMMIPTAAWPVFLVIWLRREPVRRYISDHWIENTI